MSVIKQDYLGGRYIEGKFGVHYILSETATIEIHLEELTKRRNSKHPDWDILLDAKKELEEANASR